MRGKGDETKSSEEYFFIGVSSRRCHVWMFYNDCIGENLKQFYVTQDQGIVSFFEKETNQVRQPVSLKNLPCSNGEAKDQVKDRAFVSNIIYYAWFKFKVSDRKQFDNFIEDFREQWEFGYEKNHDVTTGTVSKENKEINDTTEETSHLNPQM
jgi:hypothetical protein